MYISLSYSHIWQTESKWTISIVIDFESFFILLLNFYLITWNITYTIIYLSCFSVGWSWPLLVLPHCGPRPSLHTLSSPMNTVIIFFLNSYNTNNLTEILIFQKTAIFHKEGGQHLIPELVLPDNVAWVVCFQMCEISIVMQSNAL